jgi:hypothetical protein
MLTNYVFVDPVFQKTPIIPKGNVAVINLVINDQMQIFGIDGVPQHLVLASPEAKIVSFGSYRIARQEEKNSTCCMALQAYLFLVQNPSFQASKIYIAATESTDAVITTALIDPVVREALLASSEKLQALLIELEEFNANKFQYAQMGGPRYLNNILNIAPNFSKLPDKSRFQSFELFFLSQLEILSELGNIARIERTYPQYSLDILFSNETSVLVFMDHPYQERVNVVAQQLFNANPKLRRVILSRPVFNSPNKSVTILNVSAYDNNLTIVPYPPIKEFNDLEKKLGGSPEWRNYKTYSIGPRQGTKIANDHLWSKLSLCTS